MLFPQQTFHVSNLSSCTDSEQSWHLGCVHKCMWEADFGAVDSAIACRLEHCEDVMVTRIEDNSFGGSLCREAFQISYRITRGKIQIRRTLRPSRAPAPGIVPR